MKKYTTIILMLTINLAVAQGTKPKFVTADSTALKASFKELADQLESLRKVGEANSTSVSSLLAGKDLESKTKYDIIKANLTNTTETFDLLNERIIDLKSQNIGDDFEKLINELNNPESKVLGFSLNEKIIDLVKVHINPKEKNLAARIVASADSITKSPLLKSIPQITPAISIVTNIIGLVRSTGIVKDEIDQKKIRNLENAMSNYVSYYIALNNATQSFAFNVRHQADELGLLQQRLYNQMLVFGGHLKYPLPNKPDNQSLDIYLNNVLNKFDIEWTKKYLTGIETGYNIATTGKPDYDRILKEELGLKEANNKIEEIISLVNQFEFMYDEYFEILQSYHDNIEIALDIAKRNKIASETQVDTKKKEFVTKKDAATESLKADINLQKLKDNKATIKYSARIL
jgi:hypothetical protein